MYAFGSDRRHIVRGRERDRKRIAPFVKPFDFGPDIEKFFIGKDQVMASKKRGGGSRSKRSRRRRKIYRKRWPRALQPSSMVRTLKTAFNVALNPAAGALDMKYLTLNSAFDPTGNIGSGQPLGYDQYTALYQKTCVIGWKLNFKCTSSDNTNAIVVGFTPMTDTTTALTTYLHYLECKGTVSRHMTPDIDKVEFGHKGSVKKWMCPRGSKLLSNDFLTAEYNADPTKLLRGHLWMEAQDVAPDAGTVFITGVLEHKINW